MIPRGVLDIKLTDLWLAYRRSWNERGSSADSERAITEAWDHAHRPGSIFLSVRSALVAMLKSVDWPANSEIMMSAVTIHDMAKVILECGFVPVPIDVAKSDLQPDMAQIQSRMTQRTRAILVAHLFGCRLNLTSIADFARAHRLQLWEDLAQGYAADSFPGDELADVSLFSFGMIKAQTALGGAYARFRDPELAERCRVVARAWPQQSSRSFRKRVVRAAILRNLGRHWVYSALAQFSNLMRWDFDEVLSQSTRGFDAAELLPQLMQVPCRGLVELLKHRICHPDRNWIVQKSKFGDEYRRLLPPQVVVGADAHYPSHWVMPICSRSPNKGRAALWKQGVDATIRGSAMTVISPPADRPDWTTPQAVDWVCQLIYLPLHPALTMQKISRIAKTVAQIEAAAG